MSAVQPDVVDEDPISQAAVHAQASNRRLDVPINNAAFGRKGPELKTRLQLCINANVIGPAYVAAAFRSLLSSLKPHFTCVGSGVGSSTKTVNVPGLPLLAS